MRFGWKVLSNEDMGEAVEEARLYVQIIDLVAD